MGTGRRGFRDSSWVGLRSSVECFLEAFALEIRKKLFVYTLE